MKLTLTLYNKRRSHDIHIGSNLLHKLASSLKHYTKVLVITDTIIEKLYSKKLQDVLEGIEYSIAIIRPGEKSKSLHTIGKLLNAAMDDGLDRKSAIVAFGGGVVGDITGLVAGLYMRGIDYFQVPTTLLAQADSSIGGKVAVDLTKVKNGCGLFHQPRAVFIDINFIENLPNEELLNGLAEVVKYSIIYDKKFFEYLENNWDKVIAKDKETLVKIVTESCKIKKKIVEKDERDSGLRKILNFGHTVGQAIESASDYTVKHGEAITLGMLKESELAIKLGHFRQKDFDRIKGILDKFNTKVPKFPATKLLGLMHHDKKNIGKEITFALPQRIGKARVCTVPEIEILGVLK